MDLGIAGIDPEPRSGYRDVDTRDRELERFSNACWQRQERAKRSSYVQSWPNRAVIKSTWPKWAVWLLIAEWRFQGAYALTESSEISIDALDPKPKPKRSWQDEYALELFSCEQFERDLTPKADQAPGDNLELIYERAELTANERLVLRAYVAGQELDDLARELGWKLNTVQILLRNALYRVRFIAQNDVSPARRLQRFVPISERTNHSQHRASSDVLQRANSTSSAHDVIDRAG